MKPSLTFYTNIVSPYQLDFFSELANYFSLKVVFFSKSENDRSWNLSTDKTSYEVIFLRTNKFVRVIQKLMPSFHFSYDILSVSYNDKSKYVVLGGNYFIPNTLIALLMLSIRKKDIYWFGERVFPSGIFKSGVKKILLMPIMVLTKGIMAVGQDGINSYRNYGYNKPCYNIPYNIDYGKFEENQIDQVLLNGLRKKFNPSNKLIVLTSGSLIKRKGMDTAIESFKNISKSNKLAAELWILGDGELRADLELLASDNSNIKFLGFLQPTELHSVFILSDIFLFCSRYDGWGVVINEALSAGLPVITSQEASSCELVIKGNAGFVHQSDNVNQFTTSLNILLSDVDLRKELSVNAKTIAKKWSSAAMAQKVSEILKGQKCN